MLKYDECVSVASVNDKPSGSYFNVRLGQGDWKDINENNGKIIKTYIIQILLINESCLLSNIPTKLSVTSRKQKTGDSD